MSKATSSGKLNLIHKSNYIEPAINVKYIYYSLYSHTRYLKRKKSCWEKKDQILFINEHKYYLCERNELSS